MKLSDSNLTYIKIALPALILFLLPVGCAVTEEAETLITVSPESAVVTLGDTEQFSVTPAGTTVSWSVNGILGGNEGTVGTVDTAGLYTAPTDADAAPEKVSVSAEDTGGTSAGAVAFLTTFEANKRLTTHYTAGTSRSNTYSSGQKNIAVFKESDTGDVNVYAVWSDNSSGIYKVYFTKSGDGGVNFDVPVAVDDTSAGEQFSPAIAVDGNGDAFIVWEEHLQGDSDIYFRKYDKLAGFVLQSQQINPVATDSIDYSTSPSIAISSDEIYITWERSSDVSDDYPDIKFARSINHGSTFSGSTDLSFSGRRPVVVMNSTAVAYVAWEDLSQFPSSPTHIKLGKISSGVPGASLDLDVVSGYNARFPAMAVDPVCNTSSDDPVCEVYVVWQRALITINPTTGKEVFNSYDIDLAIVKGGTLELSSTTLSVTDSGSSGFYGGAAYPAITADDSNIYLVWDDWRNGIKDLYFSKSNGGVDFTTNRIVNDGASSVCNFLCNEKPSIAVANGTAYVVWTDYRNTQSSTTASPNDVFFAVEQ